jgi:hypothetical protein
MKVVLKTPHIIMQKHVPSIDFIRMKNITL